MMEKRQLQPTTTGATTNSTAEAKKQHCRWHVRTLDKK